MGCWRATSACCRQPAAPRWAPTILRAFIAYDESRGSVIGEKGVLALAAQAPGPEAVGACRPICAPSMCAARRSKRCSKAWPAAWTRPDPAAAGRVAPLPHRLGAGQGARTGRTDRRTARLERRSAGRPPRCPPAASMTMAGRTRLQRKAVRVTLDAALKPVLHNADGKEIKALPEPRQGDDADSVKEAKQALAGCKKELKQVVEMQAARLYDAMCTGRAWPARRVEELSAGPPDRRAPGAALAVAGAGRRGQSGEVLRPTEDGSLIDSDDNEVHWRQAACCAWRTVAAGTWPGRRLAAPSEGYKVKPLFEQLQRASPDAALLNDIDIGDRLGWVSDAFTLRGAFGSWATSARRPRTAPSSTITTRNSAAPTCAW